MADNEGKLDPYDARVTAAVEYLRGNVKWTLVAFGAIGTTLLAGSQLSNLGKFQYNDPRLAVALICAMVALIAAAAAIYSALKVAYTGYTEFFHLEPTDISYIEANPALLEGYGSVQALREAYQKAVADRHRDLTAEIKDSDLIDSNQYWFEYLDELIDHVVSYARYNRIRLEAEKTRTKLTAASVVAAVALVGFAWAANPGKDESTIVLSSPPSPAKLSLTTSGRATLLAVLGEKCAAREAIDVILISITMSNSEVVTQAIGGCPMLRITLTPGMGKLTSADGAAGATLPVGAAAANDRPIVWTQLRPDTDSAKGELIARTIVARDAPCPALTVNGARRPMDMRTDGSNPDFPIRMCEATLPGDAKAQLGDVTLKPRPRALRNILVIGDTGCRITDYAAQPCDGAAEWPFFRVARAASKLQPDLIIHVGDYHYREKPCAQRAGCRDSPYGDNWRTWEAEFFAPAAPLLTAAPWLMMRGNHEDCTRAGAGWNLLIRPQLDYMSYKPCPADADPDVFGFDKLRMIVPDTASAELDFGRDARVATYRKHIRELPKDDSHETWLLTHQALWVSYGKDDTKRTGVYDADDLYEKIRAIFPNGSPEDLCKKIISPMDTYRQWFARKVPAAAPPKPLKEEPCAALANPQTPTGQNLQPPDISLVLSGDTHTFQMFKPDDTQPENLPVQLVVGNSGDALEPNANYPDADKVLVPDSATLFGVKGKLWMRNTFGFAMLNSTDGTAWTATLYDVDGQAIAQCDLRRAGNGCK